MVNRKIYDPFFFNTAEHIAPIVNRLDDTDKKADCKTS